MSGAEPQKDTSPPNVDDSGLSAARPSLGEMFRYFLWLGSAGFGGPIALVGYMERECLERRRWVTRQEFKDGLAFSQLAPGPLAAQLAIYIGWLCAGFRGATAAGAAFVLGRRAVIDVPTAVFAAATLVLLLWAKKVPEPLVIVAAGVAGVIVHGANAG